MLKLPSSPFLYPILDTHFSKDLIMDASEAIRAGTAILQIRAKEYSKAMIADVVKRLEPICQEQNTILIVNDHVDIALVSHAAGVHLGQDDFPASEARSLLPNRIVGLSTHNRAQFEEALRLPIDYIAVGPVFETSTKTSDHLPLGIDFVSEVRKLTKKPIICIGGIREEHFGDLIQAGADGIALISELYKTGNPGDQIRYLASRISHPASQP
ncbi:MAG: thiamine phosphate synthase [Acidobacteria bacterium]|nr:MAG: thiamine phosphate synthase [Acidobacteriota bacterium]